MSVRQDERREQVQSRLESARRESPDIAMAIDFYGTLIDALLGEDALVEAPELDGDGVRRKFDAGEPILHGESLGMDEAAIRALLVRLCRVTEQFGKVPDDLNPRRLSWWQSYRSERDAAFARGVQAAKIRRALDDSELDFEALMGALLGGSDEMLTSLATKSSLDGDLMTTLARFAMRPTMRAFAQAFEPTVRALEENWQRGECPVCGSPPVLSEYHEQQHTSRMRCATCGASWKHSPPHCAFCGSDQFRAVALAQLEGDARHLVDACGVCQHYLKGVRTQDPLPDDLLPLEDLLTMPLDAAAQEAGYIK